MRCIHYIATELKCFLLMNQARDKDPLLGPGPISPSREDNAVYGKKGGIRPDYAGGGVSWLTRFVLLIIIAALVGVGLWSVELQNNLQASRATLASYDEVIADLKSQLSVTDESVSQTTAQSEDKLKQLDLEIRKLWDNVWRKAKQRLDKNEAALKSLKNQQASFLTTLNGQTDALKTFDGKLDEFQVNLNILTGQADFIPQNTDDIANANKSISTLISQLENLKADLKSMQAEQTGLAAQSDEFEEWIDSFNGYRRQVTQKLYEIEQAVQAPAAAPAAP